MKSEKLTKPPPPSAGACSAAAAPARSVCRWPCQRWRARLGQAAGYALVLALALWAAGLWHSRRVPAGAAPAFSAPVAAAGLRTPAMLSLAQWRAAHPGRAVALHFWADWCPICRAEEHSISRLVRDWPVLSVAMQSGSPQKVGQVLAERGLNWPALADAQADLARRYGVASVPAFIVIDPQGRIHSATAGYTPELSMRLRLWRAQMAGG